MSKYIIEFSKTGTICYTSHLDLMRIFKRVFKRTGIALAYSQGFNPHPKMGFAQPLSLGYESREEYIEFETADEWQEDQLLQRLAGGLPEGIELKRALQAEHLTKTLAAHTVAAQYRIEIPALTADLQDPRGMWHAYMDQEPILAWKRQKKKKEPKQVDIRPMIREITFTPAADPGSGGSILVVDALLDGGSHSNLSPELVITTVLERLGIRTDRSEISVAREKLVFDKPLEELLRGQR
ncbi:MAG: DUF2344 domain-containing protein [Firmicutes bacterium]|nr:DUF2344 domain-containing protein [Bacillota bacterium]